MFQLIEIEEDESCAFFSLNFVFIQTMMNVMIIWNIYVCSRVLLFAYSLKMQYLMNDDGPCLDIKSSLFAKRRVLLFNLMISILNTQ